MKYMTNDGKLFDEIKYVSDDGQVFDDAEKCAEYEAKREELGKIAERKLRYNEVMDARKRYVNLYNNFMRDYGDIDFPEVENDEDIDDDDVAALIHALIHIF